jgi:hypothetical protein
MYVTGRIPRNLPRSIALTLFLATLPALAQQPASDVAETLRQETGVRDSFLQSVHAAGFTCALAPPRIIVQHTPSFGNYNNEDNAIYTPAWSQMKPEEKAFFARIAGPNSDEATIRQSFDRLSHRWIFIHELGHWWQNCQHAMEGRSHYAVEYDADRIALAYWRQFDPSVVDLMHHAALAVVEHEPNPVPAGQDLIPYFDKNYETLGPTPAYPWFQAKMIVSSFEESPSPSLAAVLGEQKP